MSVDLFINDDNTWSLGSLSRRGPVYGPYVRLIDALYERERHESGATPPFGRWLIYGVQEVEPIRFDGESDEDMQSAEAMAKTLHIRDFEYEELLDNAFAIGLHQEFAGIEQNGDGTWSLKSVSYSPVARKPFERLIDAIYTRQSIERGGAPPYGRWAVVCGYEQTEVEPIRFDGESDEQMQSAATMEKMLHLREWEYDRLIVDIALSPRPRITPTE